MKTVITFGTFDVFHIGHLNIIRRARSLGDRLIVGVSSDQMNHAKKGFHPLYPLEDRLAIMSSLREVDEVFVEESMELKRRYLEQYQADILVMGNDWEGKFDDLADICEVVYLPRTKDISSSAIKERVRFPV